MVMLCMFFPRCGYILVVSLWQVLLCKQDVGFPDNTNMKDFHSLWITFYSLEVHGLFLSLFHFSSLTHTTHKLANTNQYDCIGFLSTLYSKLLPMKHSDYISLGLIHAMTSQST